LVYVDTEILERNVVSVEWASIRSKYPDVLRCEVENLLKIYFLLVNSLFCSLAIFNVDARPEPFYNFPVFIMERYLPVQKHSVSSVRNLNPRFGFERFSAG
jgi:hypothetical protein